MFLRFRIALTWLLLAALPLQGFAAATTVKCGPNHHQKMVGVVAGASEAYEYAAGVQHHHDMGAPAHHHDSASNSGDAHSAHRLDTVTKCKCSACSACCMVAAVLTAAVTWAAFAPAMAPDSFVPASLVGFVTDGPDRPPRLSLV